MNAQNIAASVRARLLNRARETNQDFNMFEALSYLGIANSRMKDYFDLWILACHTEFDGNILHQALYVTFHQRNRPLTGQIPFGLTDTFAKDPLKRKQWEAFLKKNRLKSLTLNEVIIVLIDFIMPIIAAINANKSFPYRWKAGGPWLPTDKLYQAE